MNSKILSMLVTTSVCVTALFIQPVDADNLGLWYNPGNFNSAAGLDCSDCEGIIPGTEEGPYYDSDCWELESDRCYEKLVSVVELPLGPETTAQPIKRVVCNLDCDKAEEFIYVFTDSSQSTICMTVSYAIAAALQAQGWFIEASVEVTFGVAVQVCKTNKASAAIRENVSCAADETATYTLMKFSNPIEVEVTTQKMTEQRWARNQSPDCPTTGGVDQQDFTFDLPCEGQETVSQTSYLDTYYVERKTVPCPEGRDAFINRYRHKGES